MYTERQIESFCQSHKISFQTFLKNYQRVYYPVIQNILNFVRQRNHNKPPIIGLNAPQGAGKTTLVALIKQVLTVENQLNVVTISIDDFYKTRKQRQSLAQTVHPLLINRGVPGTHDIPLAITTLKQLKSSKDEYCHIPVFNKIIDDRKKLSDWPAIQLPVDLVLFEGWCLGSVPQDRKKLTMPLNQLEQSQDPNGIWRNYSNQQLTNQYHNLFAMIDYWIYLSPPSFEAVCLWRKEQEEKLRKKLRTAGQSLEKTMNADQLAHFMMLFERITRHTIETMPKRANSHIQLDINRKAWL